MNTLHRNTLALAAALLALPAWAQITFYENDDYRGRVFSTSRPVADFSRLGFNDRASSVIAKSGRWEVCENANFTGSCMVLRPGNYPSLRVMGLNDRLSSARSASSRRTALQEAPVPPATPAYAYRQRPSERIYEAPVTSARAVMGPPTERGRADREQVSSRSDPNAGRELLGAVLGGVIGHQIGGGTGRDLASAGGAVAGAVIGANSGRDRDAGPARDVRRCSSVPAYWDVGYRFRGTQHQVQMSTEPGPTVSVNRAGEPRQ